MQFSFYQINLARVDMFDRDLNAVLALLFRGVDVAHLSSTTGEDSFNRLWSIS